MFKQNTIYMALKTKKAHSVKYKLVYNNFLVIYWMYTVKIILKVVGTKICKNSKKCGTFSSGTKSAKIHRNPM